MDSAITASVSCHSFVLAEVQFMSHMRAWLEASYLLFRTAFRLTGYAMWIHCSNPEGIVFWRVIYPVFTNNRASNGQIRQSWHTLQSMLYLRGKILLPIWASWESGCEFLHVSRPTPPPSQHRSKALVLPRRYISCYFSFHGSAMKLLNSSLKTTSSRFQLQDALSRLRHSDVNEPEHFF